MSEGDPRFRWSTRVELPLGFLAMAGWMGVMVGVVMVVVGGVGYALNAGGAGGEGGA